jgi:hypothetical protein
VVVQIAGHVQAAHRPVDDRHTRGGFADVRRQPLRRPPSFSSRGLWSLPAL